MPTGAERGVIDRRERQRERARNHEPPTLFVSLRATLRQRDLPGIDDKTKAEGNGLYKRPGGETANLHIELGQGNLGDGPSLELGLAQPDDLRAMADRQLTGQEMAALVAFCAMAVLVISGLLRQRFCYAYAEGRDRAKR